MIFTHFYFLLKNWVLIDYYKSKLILIRLIWIYYIIAIIKCFVLVKFNNNVKWIIKWKVKELNTKW